MLTHLFDTARSLTTLLPDNAYVADPSIVCPPAAAIVCAFVSVALNVNVIPSESLSTVGRV
jgi:Mg-chelatase subunit ChlI